MSDDNILRKLGFTPQALDRVADRWVALIDKYGAGAGPTRARQELRMMVKCKVIAWHQREPLAIDVLLGFPDADFAHDLGGIMRDDELMSARCAAVYHRGRQ